MEIEDFLPHYPSIDLDDFNEKIFNKKEFYDLRATSDIVQSTDSGLLQNQELLQRYVSPYSLYDEMLMIWEPGVGKTTGAISVAEKMLEHPASQMKHVLVIVSNKSLIQKFKQELVYVATKDKYTPRMDQVDTLGLSPEQIREKEWNLLNNNIRPYYTFARREAFVNMFQSLTNEQLAEQFSNHVIIMDEIHNLLSATEQISPQYKFYHRFLHSVKNRKILLLTGTPMRNNAFDFAYMLNLILPLKQQLPTGKKFQDTFIVDDTFNPAQKQVLYQAIKGRVTYVQRNTTARIEYMGEVIPPLKYIQLYADTMHPFQEMVYQEVVSRENRDDSLRKQSIQAGLFVFPNKTIGNEGFRHYFTYNTRSRQYQPTKEWKRLFNTPNKLELVQTLSTKYHAIIEQILNNPRQKCFVFSESIEEGGAIVLGQLLKEFGFRQVVSKQSMNTPRRRFAILSSQVVSSGAIGDIIQQFNREENEEGDFIQVLIGGQQIGEGYTFRDIEQIHVTIPHWNFPIIDQAIARGVRAFSHRRPNTTVQVYLHAAIPSLSGVEPVDLIIYKRAEEKDILMKRMERIIEESAWDCPLVYERNVKQDTDYSRNCKYQRCIYKCVNVKEPYIREPMELNQTTWDLYYSRQEREIIRSRLEDEFQNNWTIPLRVFLKQMATEFNPNLVLQEIVEMLSTTFTIQKQGQTYYLQCTENNLFLSGTNQPNQPDTNVLYVQSPMIHSALTFEQLIELTYKNQLLKTIQTIKQEPDIGKKIEIVTKLPLPLQQLFLKKILFFYQTNQENPFIMELINHYRPSLHELDGEIYSTLLYTHNNTIFQWKQNEWIPANVERELLAPYIENNPYGYYARFEIAKNFFTIVELDGNNDYKKTGQDCTTMKIKQKLLPMLETFNLTVENPSKQNICKTLYKFFQQNNLIFYI